MKNEKIKKKILLDLRLLLLAIPSVCFGWLSSPFLENKMFDIPALFAGVLSAPALLIVPYLIISWIFYDYFYN